MNSSSFKLEVIAFDIESCIIAQECGADRIELCASPAEGGTTPSYGFIKEARKKTTIEIFPILRPRGGDFLYSDDEYAAIISDLKLCKDLGCDGVVTGSLKADGRVDKERCAALADLAYPMGITFHRAFDRTADPMQALENIIDCGFERILTSGQRPMAEEGIDLIASLIKKADDRIIIMPGSGVRSNNIELIAKQTGAIEFHSSARKIIESKMNFINPAMREELKSVGIDGEEIRKMRRAILEARL